MALFDLSDEEKAKSAEREAKKREEKLKKVEERAQEVEKKVGELKKAKDELEKAKREAAFAPTQIDVPFVPSSGARLETMIRLAKVKPGQKAADLGCGNGKIVIALAKAGAIAYGFEIDFARACLSREKVLEAGVSDRAFIYQVSFWDVNLNSFDIVTIYGVTSIMARLEAKLKSELRPEATVISNYFTFPNWEPVEKVENVYVYRLNP